MNVVMSPLAERAGWIEIGSIADIPYRGARIVQTPQGDVAIFRTMDGKFYAIDNHCPHRQGPLAQGIVMGDAVTCPLHNWIIDLKTGEAQGADHGCVKTYGVRVVEERLFLSLAQPTPGD
jgi:nitrite reductase (NADH) small subunit